MSTGEQVTAREVLDNPELFINPVTDPRPSGSDVNELLHMNLVDDDIRKLALKIYDFSGVLVERNKLHQSMVARRGAQRALIQDVRSVVMDCTFRDVINEPPTVTMTLHDPDWELLNSGALDNTIDINPGNIRGRWYRLDRIDVNDDDLVLTFITRNAAYLQYKKRPYKISRNKVTRAEFILTLLHHVKRTKIRLFCPQLHVKQPIAQADGEFVDDTGLTTGGDTLLYVGDSLGVGTVPPLRTVVKGVYKIQAYTDESQASPWGVDHVKAHFKSRHFCCIFDLGTNDGNNWTQLHQSLVSVRKLVGTKPLIVYTMNGAAAGMNDDLTAWVRDQPNVRLADWRKLSQDNNLVPGDGIHPDAAGYAQRATLVKGRIATPARSKSSSNFDTSSKSRDSKRASGLSTKDGLTVKGSPADSAQVANIEAVLIVGVRMRATPRMLVASIMTIIQEAEAKQSATNGQFVGLFQQSKRYNWPATRDPWKDAPAFFKAFIPIAKKNPDEDLGKLIQRSQGADPNLNPQNQGYWMEADRWRGESEKAVKKFLGRDINIDADPTGTQQTQVAQKYEFMVGPDDGPKNENYLAAIYRLADEVNWSAYWVRDVLHFMSEEDLFKSKARMRIRRYENGVESVQFGIDRAHKVHTMTLQVRMEKWFAPIATVVTFDEGGAGEGRWLVTGIERSAFSQLGTVTLEKPMREKKEPAHKLKDKPVDDSSTDSGPTTIGDIEGSPKDIIDNVVIPMAQSIDRFKSGFNSAPLGPHSVEVANHHHGHTVTGSISDHEGPPERAWAADMSVDWIDHRNGIKPMLELAKQLQSTFDLPNYKGGCFSSYSKDKHYRYQICYLTDTGGDHWNHVHFGVKINGPIRRTKAQDRKQSGN